MITTGVTYRKNSVWVSLEWLKHYYTRPDKQIIRSAWKVSQFGVCYQSVIDSIKRRRNRTKLNSMPTYEALEAFAKKQTTKEATKVANKNAEKLQNWHKAILNELYANAMPIHNPTHIHRLYSDIINKTICQLLERKKIQEVTETYYIAIEDIINSSTGELIIAKNSKVYPPVSLRSVERYLNTKIVQALYDGERYGRDKGYATYTPTKGVSAKHRIWGMDGYTNNFYLNNTYTTCVTYVIVDVFDGEILAVATGKSETLELQLEAWKAAIEYAGCFPQEVEVDGNNAIDYIADVVNIKHLRRKNKQGYFIEGWFGQMQSNVWRKKAGYRGDNILAKKDGARMNKDINVLDAAQYPTIKMEQIHNEWLAEMEKSRQNKADAVSVGQKAEAHQIARLFGEMSNVTIARGFVKIKKQLFEVPAELHLHPKLPNDWKVQTAVYNGECHIYNQGVYIATLKETVKPSRSGVENKDTPEVIGHHIQRQKALEKMIETQATAKILSIPDEAEAIIDAASSPEYWTKITEKALDNALSEVMSTDNRKAKKLFDVSEEFDNKPLEIIKTA